MTKSARPRGAPRIPPRRAPHRHSELETVVLAALEEMKAVNIRHYDVRGHSDVADVMIIASGNSDRHVRAIAERTIEKARSKECRPLGVEGLRDGEWVLVDLRDVVLHVMLPRVREFCVPRERCDMCRWRAPPRKNVMLKRVCWALFLTELPWMDYGVYPHSGECAKQPSNMIMIY